MKIYATCEMMTVESNEQTPYPHKTRKFLLVPCIGHESLVLNLQNHVFYYAETYTIIEIFFENIFTETFLSSKTLVLCQKY